jgi:hypothetical protein
MALKYVQYLFKHCVFAILFVISLNSCMSPAKYLQRGEYEKAVELSVTQLKKKPSSVGAKNVLRSAYPIVIEQYLNTAKNAQVSNDFFQWNITLTSYEKINEYKKVIENTPAAKSVIIDPVNKLTEISDVRKKAAAEKYEAGMKSMFKNTSKDVLQAYIYFDESNKLSPGYLDVLEMMNRLEQMDSFKVVRQQAFQRIETKEVKKNESKPIKSGPWFTLGLNNYFNAEQTQKIKLFGSWYTDIGWLTGIKLGGSRPSRIVFYPCAGWYNFKYSNLNVYPDNTNGFTTFNIDTLTDLEVSKLTAVYASLKTSYWTKIEGRLFDVELMFGPYFSYRIDSYSKKGFTSESGKKDIILHNDFNLNDFRYGMYGSIVLNSMGFFIQYDLNTLFKNEKGPSLNAFTVGLSFTKKKYF